MVVIPWSIYAFVVILNKGFDLRVLLLGLVLLIPIYGIVAIHNDISDYETDKLNRRKDIPLVSGDVKKENLIYLLLSLAIITILVGLLLDHSVLIWVALYLLLGWLYSGPANLKNRSFIAAFLLGACYGAIPWYLGVAAAGIKVTLALVIVSTAYFIFSSGSTVIKDFRDLKGDKKAGKNTILVSKGKLFTRVYYLFMTSSAYIILLTGLIIYRQYLLTIISPLFIYSNYMLLSDKTIFDNPKIRSAKSSRSRSLFFIFSVLTYAFLIH
jgi:4-hydroxybenzoate polyprenyltransferase